MRAPWLGDVLTDAGLRVATPVGDPLGRGREMDTIYGVVVHDTVTTTGWSDLSVARLLRDGRPDLSGPLSQLGLRRDGTFDWIADGRCHHNGYGTWGNDAIGIEVYAAGGLSGREEPWNDVQRESVVVACRAILDHLDLGRSSYWNPRVAGHKETDPNRKVDPYQVDMGAVRRDVSTQVLAAGGQTQEAPMQEPSKWAKPSWDKAKQAGVVTSDTEPHDAVDKQELMVLLDRAGVFDTAGGPHTHEATVTLR